MKFFAAFCAFALLSAASAADPVTEQFSAFKLTFNKTYASAEEEAQRLAIFAMNLGKIATYNAIDTGARYEVNAFADMSEDEFAAMYLDRSNMARGLLEDAPVAPDVDTNASFTAVDWTTKGAVTPVKNQGQCGSCWAFSTTGNIEGVGFVKNKKLVSLSEQQLVDCDTKGQDQGCKGGLPSNAAAYILKNGGIDTEDSYPYTGTDDTCKYKSSDVGAKITGWTKISTDENQIAAQLNQRGPLSIGINAGMMQLYGGGVACPWKLFCNPKNIDHGVLIVGVGTDGGKDYWKIKNSWGAMWGEKGYYRICKDKGACGVNTMVGSVEM